MYHCSLTKHHHLAVSVSSADRSCLTKTSYIFSYFFLGWTSSWTRAGLLQKISNQLLSLSNLPTGYRLFARHEGRSSKIVGLCGSDLETTYHKGLWKSMIFSLVCRSGADWKTVVFNGVLIVSQGERTVPNASTGDQFNKIVCSLIAAVMARLLIHWVVCKYVINFMETKRRQNKVKLAKAMNLCIVLEIILLATKKEKKNAWMMKTTKE